MVNDVKIQQSQLDVNSFASISQEQNTTIGAKMLDNGYVQLFASDNGTTPPTGNNAITQQMVAKHMLFEAIENTYQSDIANQLFSSDGAGAALFNDKPLTAKQVNNLMMKAEELAQNIDQTQVETESETDEIVETKPNAFIRWLSSIGEWISNKLDALLSKAAERDDSITEEELKKLEKDEISEQIMDDLVAKSDNGKTMPTQKEMEETAIDTIVKNVKKNRDDDTSDVTPAPKPPTDDTKTVTTNDDIIIVETNDDDIVETNEDNFPVYSKAPPIRSDVENLNSYLSEVKNPDSPKFENLLKKALQQRYPDDKQSDDLKFMEQNLDFAKARKFVERGFEMTKSAHGEDKLAALSGSKLNELAVKWLDQFMDKTLELKGKSDQKSVKFTSDEVNADMDFINKTLGARADSNVRAHQEANAKAGYQFLQSVQDEGLMGVAIDCARDPQNNDRLGGGRLKPESWDSNAGVKPSDVRKAILKAFAKHPDDVSKMDWVDKNTILINGIKDLIRLPDNS